MEERDEEKWMVEAERMRMDAGETEEGRKRYEMK